MLKVCRVSTWHCSTPVLSQEVTASGAKTGLVVAGVRFCASVNHNGNYLKMFPVDCPAVCIDETRQVYRNAVPANGLRGSNIHGRVPIHLKAYGGCVCRKTTVKRCLVMPKIDQVLDRAHSLFCLLKEDRSVQLA